MEAGVGRRTCREKVLRKKAFVQNVQRDGNETRGYTGIRLRRQISKMKLTIENLERV